jgi:HAD superfamily hydrolase (TIGR01549 family)
MAEEATMAEPSGTAGELRWPVVVCDLDGTLLDSDRALADAFVAFGVPRDQITYGHVVADECARLGIALDDYLAAYDTEAAQPFPGVDEVVAALGRWAICSNKHPRSGRDELARLGWHPEVALFADAFGGPKHLGPVLDALDVGPGDVLYVGDTGHDRACSEEVGCAFALAGWNPRACPVDGDRVLHHPRELLGLVAGLDDARRSADR